MDPRTVTYATRIRDGREWKVDVYAPPGAQVAPVAILLPGESSDRSTEAFRALAAALCQRGIAALLAEHWPAPGPVMFKDGGAGFREATELVVCLVRQAAGLVGAMVPRVVIYGQSAGGIDGLFVALAEDQADEQWDSYEIVHRRFGQQVACRGHGPCEVAGFVGYAGGYEAPWMLRELNPALAGFLSPRERMDRPPKALRFLTGLRDSVIPPELAARHEELFLALGDVGHDVELRAVEDAHIPTTGSPGWTASLESITELAQGPDQMHGTTRAVV